MGAELTIDVLWAALLGYACGSIPFGLLLTRFAGMGDVRDIGSGSIGATNVLRTGNKWIAAATLLLDLAKGFAAVVLADTLLLPFDGHMHSHPLAGAFDPVPVAAVFAVIGHCFPIWLGFKGGKGVATNAGVSFGLAWPIGLAYALVWLGVLAVSRISSLAGMSAVVVAAIVAAVLGYTAFVPALVLIALIVIWLHRANLKRLANGTEPKVGSKG